MAAKINGLCNGSQDQLLRAHHALGDDEGDRIVLTLTRDHEGGFTVVLSEGTEVSGTTQRDQARYSASKIARLQKAVDQARCLIAIQTGTGGAPVH